MARVRRRSHPMRVIAGVVCLGLALLTGCESSPKSGPQDPTPTPGKYFPDPCELPANGPAEVSDKGVLPCGALWGVTTQTPDNAALSALEQKVGRRFDMVYRFHDIDDEIPSAEERQLVDEGRLLHITIESRSYSDTSPADGTWAAIAAGKHDAALLAQAQGIASLGAAVFVTFDHEVDQSARLVLGSTDEYVAAWRHINEVFARAGADNAIWVWVILGWAESLPLAAKYWPGNDVVDWISWDIYNQSGCRGAGVDASKYTTFEEDVALVYDWMHEIGPDIGMDPSKPVMISEFGSVLYDDDPQRTADWYAAIPDVLEKYSQIKAVSIWDHTGNLACDYRIDRDDVVLDAVIEAGKDPWVNQFG